MSEEETTIEERQEIKSEFVGCYVTEGDKNLVEAMATVLYGLGYLSKPYVSEVIRLSLNLCYSFVKTSLRDELDKQIQRLEQQIADMRNQAENV